MTLHRNRCFVIVDPPTEDDLSAVNEVIDAFDFPWEWTLADNVRDTGKADLPIGFDDKSGSLGYFTPPFNSIHVDPIAVHQGGRERFGKTLAHELSHYVDDTVLSSETKVTIHRLMHDGSPMTYDECVTKANAGRERPISESALWRVGKAHSDRPIEAFGNLGPHMWCPKFAKTAMAYGPHYFTHFEDIRELVMADAVKNPPFKDIAGHTFEADVLWAARQGIAYGHRGMFNPDDIVTRGQMAAFLRRAVRGMTEEFAVPDGPTPELKDIAGHTFEADIIWAAQKGITQGDGQGNFRPNDPVTRGAMAAFLHRALEPSG